jgi:hypothetical protein
MEKFEHGWDGSIQSKEEGAQGNKVKFYYAVST